jgi:predicted Fe-S protein YdhL (DUF1289 family)
VSTKLVSFTNTKRTFASAVLLCMAQSAWSQVSDPGTIKAVTAAELSQKTDTELTQLTAQWGHLSPSERRNLLAEVRGRMAASKKISKNNSNTALQIVQGPVRVRVQRRYGRLVRKPDGSVVMQTRVVEVHPASPSQVQVQPTRSADGKVRARVTFGIGFEQRSKARIQPQQSVPPSVTVSQVPQSDPAP